MSEKKDMSLAPVPPSRMMIILSPISGWIMVVFLCIGLSSTLWAVFVSNKINLLPSKVDWEKVMDGEITHHISKELADVSLAKKAAEFERAASWLFIGDMGARVHHGCGNWLFLVDELKVHPYANANAMARLAKVRTVRDFLAKKNIGLLVVLIPDKSRIVSEKLCSLRAVALNDRILQWQLSAQQEGIETINLDRVLQPLGESAFLHTDTHWSERGAETAAIAVAKRVHDLGVEAFPLKLLKRSVGSEKIYAGDLIRLAGLDWLPVSFQPQGEVVAASVFKTSEPGEAVTESDLFGDSKLPNLALVGTSFSRNSNFVPFLEKALGASVGNFAKDGGGFSGSIKDFLESSVFKQTPPKLLIWEILERDLQPPYLDDMDLLDK